MVSSRVKGKGCENEKHLFNHPLSLVLVYKTKYLLTRLTRSNIEKCIKCQMTSIFIMVVIWKA